MEQTPELDKVKLNRDKGDILLWESQEPNSRRDDDLGALANSGHQVTTILLGSGIDTQWRCSGLCSHKSSSQNKGQDGSSGAKSSS